MTYKNMQKIMPVSRFKHCYMVGIVMEYIAKKYYKYDNTQAAEMFILGYLHDSMYDYETDESLHHDIIADLVPTKYKEPLKYHSKYQTDYKSDPLDMLYLADQIVDGQGKICSFDDRISDVMERHGKDDGVYQDTVDIVEYLNSKEIFRTIEQDVCSNEELKNTIIPIEEMTKTWEDATKKDCSNNPQLYLEILLSGAKEFYDNFIGGMRNIDSRQPSQVPWP